LENRNYAHLACARVMTRDDDLRVRIGRIRDKGSARRAKPFIAQALAAAEKAGGLHRRSGRGARSAAFGRGRAASLAATRLMTDRARNVVIKARVVRQRAKGAALSTHLAYLRREGVTKDGTAGRLFDAEHDDADHRAFAERCEGNRHHFRFIVSPQDADQLSDLKAFTRDLMAQAERDLGAKLDWVGVDHWNTDNPHIHVIVRGKGDDSRDLVIARDYISQGLRARAANLATLELGPRSDLEMRRDLDAQVEADRWTKLDRALAREAAQNDGVVDLRPGADPRAEGLARPVLIGRMHKLERLGLAEPLGAARWRLSENAKPIMRALGERTDIIKRIHRGLADHGIERSVADFALDGGDATPPIIGRLVARGLHDELKGTAYAVIDGVDGRAHHVCLPDLDAASDATPGSIVELRRFQDAFGRQCVALAVRSDFTMHFTVVRVSGRSGADSVTNSRAVRRRGLARLRYATIASPTSWVSGSHSARLDFPQTASRPFLQSISVISRFATSPARNPKRASKSTMALSRRRRSPAQAAIARSTSSATRYLGTDASCQLAMGGRAYSRPAGHCPVATRKRRKLRIATA
jgi:type IV secretory pathway VirD2 relaxase